MDKKKVLITGISGSVGHYLALFLQNRGYDVYGTLRTGRSAEGISVSPDKIICYDMEDQTQLQMPANIHTVVHCAAATSETVIDPELSKKINVLGTKKLLDACVQSGVQRFIFISSMSANPQNPSIYAQTKLLAEDTVKKYASLLTTILRPGLIITESGKGIFNKLFNYVKILPIVPCIGNNRNLNTIHINDLCETIISAIETDIANGMIIDTCADESLGIKDIVKMLSKKINKNVLCISIPYRFAFAIATLSAWIGKPLLTKDNVYGLMYAQKADTRNLKEVLKVRVKPFQETLNSLK